MAPSRPPLARKMDRAAFKPTVPKPSYGVIYGFVRTKDTADVKAWNVAPLGGTRFATVVSGRAKAGKAYYAVVAAVDGTANAAKLGAEASTPGPVWS